MVGLKYHHYGLNPLIINGCADLLTLEECFKIHLYADYKNNIVHQMI